MENPKQVSVKGDNAALVDDSTITTCEVNVDQNSMNSLKPVCEADQVDSEWRSVSHFVPETNLNNGTTQPVHPSNLIENELNNVATPSATCSDLQELVSTELEFDPFSNILPDPGARNVHKFKPKIKPRPRAGNTIASPSFNAMEKSVELHTSCINNFQSFQSCGDASGGLTQSASLTLPSSEILRTTDLPSKFDDTSSSIAFSEDNKSLAAAITFLLDSQSAMHSEDVVHNGTRDWPSSFGKSLGEAADIFSRLESVDDFLTQATTDTGKPAVHSFNEKGAEENFVKPACSSINPFAECDSTQVQSFSEYDAPQDSLTCNEVVVLNEDDTHTNSRRSEIEEIVDLNPACPGDDVFDYQSMNSGEDPASEIPVHEELTNAADSPTLADFLHADVTREKEDANKRKRDDSTSCSLRKSRISSISGEEDKGGTTSRQLRKQAAHKPASHSLNEDVEDNNDLDPPYNSNGDELQENDDDYEVNYPFKKKRVSTNSKKKSMAKSGKTSQKCRRANDDLEKTKEPPKKFSHSTRRRKRCVDKALLEIPEDELDRRTLPMKDIILLGGHWEQLAKKEAMTSNTSSTIQSGGDSLHEAGAYKEWEFSGSDDGRDPYDDQANEGITSTPALFNYHSLREKVPRAKWSKQDTELFYEAVRMCCTEFSMINEYYFPHKTRHQIKLKYKKEEREHPSLLNDALCNPAKDYNLLIERVKLASTKAKEDPNRNASDFMMAEEVVDQTAGTNEFATTKEDPNVKAQEDSMAVHSAEQSDDSDDDIKKWSQYKSLY